MGCTRTTGQPAQGCESPAMTSSSVLAPRTKLCNVDERGYKEREERRSEKERQDERRREKERRQGVLNTLLLISSVPSADASAIL